MLAVSKEVLPGGSRAVSTEMSGVGLWTLVQAESFKSFMNTSGRCRCAMLFL